MTTTAPLTPADVRDALLDLAPEVVTVEVDPTVLPEFLCEAVEDCDDIATCRVDSSFRDETGVHTNHVCLLHVTRHVEDGVLGAGASRVLVTIGAGA